MLGCAALLPLHLFTALDVFEPASSSDKLLSSVCMETKTATAGLIQHTDVFPVSFASKDILYKISQRCSLRLCPFPHHSPSGLSQARSLGLDTPVAGGRCNSEGCRLVAQLCGRSDRTDMRSGWLMSVAPTRINQSCPLCCAVLS